MGVTEYQSAEEAGISYALQTSQLLGRLGPMEGVERGSRVAWVPGKGFQRGVRSSGLQGGVQTGFSRPAWALGEGVKRLSHRQPRHEGRVSWGLRGRNLAAAGPMHLLLPSQP